jgi:diguanylate cyclase (GGDEF)-like protein/PAS domain S-box-containing protein
MRRYNKHGMLFAVIIYVLWVVTYAYFDFKFEKKRLYQAIDKRLEYAALITPVLLPENFHHKGLAKGDLTPQRDFSNTQKLSKLTDINSGVKYIYTLVLRDNKIFFTSSSATKDERDTGQGLTSFFDQYKDVDPRVYEVFSLNQARFLEYTDRWGTFRSIYVPQYADDGSLFVTAADISISDIQAILNQRLRNTVLVAILFLFFAYPLYLLSTQKIKRAAKELERKVQQQTAKLSLNEERLNYALKVAHQGWFDLNPQTGEILVGDEYARLLGYEPQEFHPYLQTWQVNIHPDDKLAVQKAFKQMLATNESAELEYRRKCKDGRWIWLHSIGEVVERDSNNNPTRVIGIHADITERKQNDQVLRLLAESGGVGNETIFQLMVKQLAHSQNSRYAFIACVSQTTENQIDTIAVWADDDYRDNFSYSPEGTPCQNVTETGMCFYPDNIQGLFPDDTMLAEMDAVSYQGIVLKNSQNQAIGLLAILDDRPMTIGTHTSSLLNSLAVRAAIELERIESGKQLALAARVFNDSHEAIMLTDINGDIINVNPAFTEITGYEYSDIVGENPSIFSSGQNGPEFYIDMWEKIHATGFWHGEVSNRKKNGDSYIELLTISALKDEHDNILNYLGMFSDITQTKEQQEKLHLMAHYDVLTQLPNRTLFADRFSQAVSHSKRNETLLAICFLDLDDFKPVNDQYGHEVGDLLLIEVAKRIKAELRDEDTVSRQGGDEFALLLKDLMSVEECGPLLTRLHHSLAQPYQINGHLLMIGASSGVTVYPSDDSDIDTLLRHADQAMYQAKLAGKNRYKIFNAEHDLKTIQQQNKLHEIQQALLNDELCLYYQPKVNMKTGKVFGMEALIRWLHPEKGIIPPLDFLPLISGTDLEIQVGEWVINQALKQMSIWQEQAIALEVSVNISSYHLQDKLFIEQLNSALALVPTINAKHFQIEILESSALGDIQTINRIIKHCRDRLGVKIALDDFGTGYSSLTHLRSLAITTIKIDQSFVRDMLDDPSDYAIINSVIGLADSFGREVIAEGVETTEHGLMLLIMGCELAQGYGIARPMPASDMPQWLSQYKPNQQWLATAKQSLTTKEIQLRLLTLTTEQWQRYFEKNILAKPSQIEYWPIMTKNKCQCGTWIKRARQDTIFSDKWLLEFESVHNEMHHIANDLLLKYENNLQEEARLGLAQLRTSFESIEQLISSEIIR